MVSNPTSFPPSFPTSTQPISPKRPPLGEMGSASAQQGLFTVNDYGVFNKPSPLDLERMLDTDSTCRALESSITMPIREATSYIEEAAKDSGEAAFCREVIFSPPHAGGMRTPIDKLIAQMCSAFGRRTSFHELVLDERDDGKLVIADVAFRRASTCWVVPDNKGRFAGFIQQGFTTEGKPFEVQIPREKSFVYIHGSSAINPLQGESVFESAYHNYDFKRRLLVATGLYFQKFGIPPTFGKTESGLAEDQDAMLTKAQNLSGGGTAALGPGEDITALEVKPGADFNGMFRYLDSQMAISTLVQWLMLGTGSNVGSWALSRDHSDFFMLATHARMSEIAAKITSDILAPLVYYNFGKDAAYPTFRFASMADESEAAALDIWRSFLLAPAGSQGAMALHPTIYEAIQQKALAAMAFDPSAYKNLIPHWLLWGTLSKQGQGQGAPGQPAQGAPGQPGPGPPGVPNVAPPPPADQATQQISKDSQAALDKTARATKNALKNQ